MGQSFLPLSAATMGEKKDAVALTVQQVTDFVHVDFKIRDLAERKRRVQFLSLEKKKKDDCLRESSADLDVEFQVLIHGKDVVENVLGDTGDDAHQVRVVQLALRSQSESHLCFKQQQLKAKKKRRGFSSEMSLQSTKTFIQNLFSFSLPSCCVLPPLCESSRRRFVRMRKWCHCIHPEHLKEERKREENQVAATKTYSKDFRRAAVAIPPLTICLAEVLYTCSWVVLVGNTRSKEKDFPCNATQTAGTAVSQKLK